MPVSRARISRVPPAACTFSAATSHIMPGPYLGYWNSSMSVVISVWPRLGRMALMHRLAQVEVLHPLGRPVGRHLGDRHAPHLLGVGLEEGAVEPPAEAGDQPVLVVRLVLGRPDAGPHVGEAAQDGLPQPQVPQRVDRLERVVVELALVVDPAHAGPQHEVALGQDLVPEGLHLGNLGEETVAAQVEAPPVPDHGAADAAHHVIGLEHDRVLPPLGQEIGRGEPSGPAPAMTTGAFSGAVTR